MNRVRRLLVFASFLVMHFCGWSQNDTIPSYIKGKQGIGERVTDTLPHGDNIRRNGHKVKPYAIDSLAKKHDPRKATIYSAICPGLGQIYNHKYWKLPLVYAAIGIPAYTFFYNKKWYQKCQFALAAIDNYTSLGLPIPGDTLNRIDPKLLPFVQGTGDDNDLRNYRNEFRKDQDYSVLFFLLFWGLNVVDATVDAHLKEFDVSDQLTMRLEPPSGSSLISGMNLSGISLVLDWHKPRHKLLPPL